MDPCENPYPQSGYRFLVGMGTGTSKGYLCISLAAEPTQDVDTAPEPSDHGLYEDPLVASQYTSEGEDYPLEAYEEYSDNGDGE